MVDRMEYLEFHELCSYSGRGKGGKNEHREIERRDEIDERGSFASRRVVLLFVSTNNFRKMEYEYDDQCRACGFHVLA